MSRPWPQRAPRSGGRPCTALHTTPQRMQARGVPVYGLRRYCMYGPQLRSSPQSPTPKVPAYITLHHVLRNTLNTYHITVCQTRGCTPKWAAHILTTVTPQASCQCPKLTLMSKGHAKTQVLCPNGGNSLVVVQLCTAGGQGRRRTAPYCMVSYCSVLHQVYGLKNAPQMVAGGTVGIAAAVRKRRSPVKQPCLTQM